MKWKDEEKARREGMAYALRIAKVRQAGEKMSDLISRSALLKKMNDTGVQITFDLPVEEILGEDVDIDDFTVLVQDAIQAYRKMVIDTIKDIPTAYDVEKVVEELEEFTKLAEDRWVNGTSNHAYQEHKCWVKAIDIVKRGGIE